MKTNSFKALSLAAILSIGFVADAAAHNPTGRRRTGTIENIDPSTSHLTFRADRDDQSRTFAWNKRTRFVHDVSFVEAAAMRKSARAEVIYHTPFFGEPFVTRVFLSEPAPKTRSYK